MKKLILISKGNETLSSLYKQLEMLLREDIEIEPYCIEDIPSTIDSNALVLITSLFMKDRVLNILGRDIDYIIGKRIINYKHLNKLVELPSKTKVLLVNDHQITCEKTIKNLIQLGLNHVEYFPYYPEIEKYETLPFAITPGESFYCPPCVKKTIDIKSRQLDITTIVEILVYFGIIDKYRENLSSFYVNGIVSLLKDYNDEVNRTLELKNMFEIIVNNSNDAIIYLDTNGTIKEVNHTFRDILVEKNSNIINKNIVDILPELKGFSDGEIENDIFKINGENFIIDKNEIKQNNSVIGYMITIENAMKIREIEHKFRRKIKKDKGLAKYKFKDIIFKSEIIEKTIELSKKLSSSSSSILIQGESGTGKEIFAQAIHNHSNRRDQQFIPINFAALPNSLIESELFGYEDGAFTGAKKGGKEGLFEEAHGGTIFLDEIGDASLEIQARLLRVLQEKQVRRISSLTFIPVDCKIIAATNRNLIKLVEKGKFRKDLFYRLNILPINIPSLRERKEDVILLISHYLKKFTKSYRVEVDHFFNEDTIQFLKKHDWPGNIRQLVNTVEYLVNIKERGKLIDLKDLPSYIISNQLDIKHFKESHCNDTRLLILKILLKKDFLGRRKITEAINSYGKNLSEAKIRDILNEMQTENLISNDKNKGNYITDIGKKFVEDD